MDKNTIELREPTPTLQSKKCKLLANILTLFLQTALYLITAISWYFYDYFIALLTLVLSFIVMGIIRSKLRNSSIPLSQREYQYTDKEIALWYVAKEICFEQTSNS